MMDKILKFLLKLSEKERGMIMKIMKDIQQDMLSGYDIQKLINQENMRRIRKGNIRIIYHRTGQCNVIINIDWRGNVY